MKGHPVTQQQVTIIENMIRRGCLEIPVLAHESDLSGRTVLRVILLQLQSRLQREHADRRLFELIDPHESG